MKDSTVKRINKKADHLSDVHVQVEIDPLTIRDNAFTDVLQQQIRMRQVIIEAQLKGLVHILANDLDKHGRPRDGDPLGVRESTKPVVISPAKIKFYDEMLQDWDEEHMLFFGGDEDNDPADQEPYEFTWPR